MSETTLSVGFTTVQAPLGLVLLIVTALLALLFLIYVVYLQSSVLLENRRQSRELQNQREIAEKCGGVALLPVENISGRGAARAEQPSRAI